MRTVGHFDRNGVVRGVIIHDLPEGFEVGLAPSPGIAVAELDGLSFKNKELSDIAAVRARLATGRVPPRDALRVQFQPRSKD
jgi:hypothetical protein